MNATTTNAPPDFELRLQFAVLPDHLFAALSTMEGCKGWWTRYCEVSEAVGGQSAFRFPSAEFFAVMKTLRREPPRLLEWECVDSKHAADTGYTDLRDWVGTRIQFQIRALGDGVSELHFTHFRLNQLECLTTCSAGWNFFLNDSLRGYLENGAGKPWDERG